MFEVADAAAARVVLARLGLHDDERVRVHERVPHAEARHLEAITSELERAVNAAPGLHCVFTGKAGSIQVLYKAARRVGVSSKRVTNVAYWAPGRKGFSGVQR